MEKKFCTPVCKHFRCAQNQMQVKYKGSKKLIFCGWAGGLCIGSRCKYAICAIGKLRSDGTCGLKISQPRRRPQEKDEFLDLVAEERKSTPKVDVHLKQRVLKKLKDIDEFYD